MAFEFGVCVCGGVGCVCVCVNNVFEDVGVCARVCGCVWGVCVR